MYYDSPSVLPVLMLLGLLLVVTPALLALVALVRAGRAGASARAAEELAASMRDRLEELERRLGVEGPDIEAASAEAGESRAREAGAPAAPEPPMEARSLSLEPEPVSLKPGTPEPAAGTSRAPAGSRPSDSLARTVSWLAGIFSSGANLARLGSGLILAGVAFFLEYGTQTGLLPEGTRLVAALLVGVAMIVTGLALARRRPAIGLALQGAGIGIVYAALFAGHNLLHLLSAGPTFVGLVLLSFAAVGLAWFGNSPSLAFLALVGGLAAPALVSSDGADLVFLFSYYLVLNLAVLAVSVLRGWRSVHTAAFILTFVTGGVVGGLQYRSEALLPAEPFLVAFFLIYFASTLALAYGYPERPLPLGSTVTLPVMTLLLQAGILERVRVGLGLSAAVLAAVYLAAAWLLARSRVPGWTELARMFGPIPPRHSLPTRSWRVRGWRSEDCSWAACTSRE
jgi:uncharacterized membrane protein